MKTKTLNVTYVNLSDFMEYLDEQELDDFDEVLGSFPVCTEGDTTTLVNTSAFKFELYDAPRLMEKFEVFEASENHAFKCINISA